MKKSLSDYLVFCDMDNTLLTADEGIPSCNRTVIKLFTQLGGRFTVTTGRPPESIRAALGDIKLSFPAIACNGALLYDFSTNTVLHHSALNITQATNAITDIMKKFPHIGVEVFAGDGDMYIVQANDLTHAHQRNEKLSSISMTLDSLPERWLKVVFAADPETIRKMSQYIKTRYYGKENYFIVTSNIYLEIMPSGVGQAAGMRDVCMLMREPIEKTVAIGDYYSDLELMHEAGYAVAVANAPAEVRAAADKVTICNCSEGGVGEYLYHLIRTVEKDNA